MRIFVLLISVFSFVQAADGREYSFVDPRLSDGYGFSGTLTTDGRTGSFNTAEPIVDWSVQLTAPGADGVLDELLTPDNSFLQTTLDFRDRILVIDEHSVYLDSERISVNTLGGDTLFVFNNERTIRLGFFWRKAEPSFLKWLVDGLRWGL